MSMAIPSLSTDAWIANADAKADRLLAYFFANQASQSNAFRGNITSLASIIQQYGSDPNGLENELRARLNDFIGPYFDITLVDVSVITVDTILSGRTDIKVSITVTQNGVTEQFGQLAKLYNGKVVEIINLLNNGTT